MLNWLRYEVSEDDFRSLVEQNRLIPVSSGALPANAGVEIYTSRGNQMNAIYDANMGGIRCLKEHNPQYKKMPNRDLLLYNDHLLNENINTIIVDGFWGTGKTSTMCSHLVPGLTSEYSRKRGGIPMAFISKPHESLGKSHGHLPGELEDKTFYEFQSFTQYFKRFGQIPVENFLNGDPTGQVQPLLEILTFEYLRGRDIEEGWVVLDEAQNCNLDEICSFISRGCDNAKYIVMGDTTRTQIDKRGNTPEDNGLTFAINTYWNKKYVGVVQMQTVNHILRGKRAKDLFLALRGGQQ